MEETYKQGFYKSKSSRKVPQENKYLKHYQDLSPKWINQYYYHRDLDAVPVSFKAYHYYPERAKENVPIILERTECIRNIERPHDQCDCFTKFKGDIDRLQRKLALEQEKVFDLQLDNERLRNKLYSEANQKPRVEYLTVKEVEYKQDERLKSRLEQEMNSHDADVRHLKQLI